MQRRGSKSRDGEADGLRLQLVHAGDHLVNCVGYARVVALYTEQTADKPAEALLTDLRQPPVVPALLKNPPPGLCIDAERVHGLGQPYTPQANAQFVSLLADCFQALADKRLVRDNPATEVSESSSRVLGDGGAHWDAADFPDKVLAWTENMCEPVARGFRHELDGVVCQGHAPGSTDGFVVPTCGR